MEKNGNTYSPGDPVRHNSHAKIASGDGIGKVLSVDPSTEMVEVEWESGRTTFEKLAELRRG